jgi:hypothetical protein
MSAGSLPAWFYSPLSIRRGRQWNLPLSQAFNSDLESILAAHLVRRSVAAAGILWNRTQARNITLVSLAVAGRRK